jgi:AcrR family transcriptional regulator
MIATAAGCSPAALYRFFPDREAIFDAVNAQLQEELQAAYQRVLETDTGHDVDTAISRLIDATSAYARREPAFHALRWRNGSPTKAMQAAYRATNDLVADALWRRFGANDSKTKTSVRTAVEAAGHLVGLAFEQNERGDRRMLEDAKRMATLFLTDVFPPARPVKRARAKG